MKNRDNRISKSSDDLRASRTEEENIRGEDEKDHLVTAQASDRPFKDEFNFECLPNPNETGNKEFHYFWATTTNSQDTPHRRMRMGYQLVMSEERPEFKHLRLKAGEFEGVISMNEMILMKIPMSIYQQLMLEQHHHKPNDREQSLKASATKGSVDKNGAPIDVRLPEDEGYRELGKPRRIPATFE